MKQQILEEKLATTEREIIRLRDYIVTNMNGLNYDFIINRLNAIARDVKWKN